MTKRKAISQGSLLAGFFLLCLGFLQIPGCGGLKISRALLGNDANWWTAGNNISRTSFTTEKIVPPLTRSWEYDITAGIGNASPIVVDSVLLVGNLRGELHALNIRTGKRIGWISLGNAIQGAPLIDRTVAFVTASGTNESLISFDFIDGKIRWKKSYGDIETSPLLLNQKLYFGNTAGGFYCIDRNSGDVIWKYEIPNNKKRKGIRSSAAGTETIVVFGSEAGFVYALDPETGKEKWKQQTKGSVFSTPVIASNNVLIADISGTVSALDISNGEIIWKFEAAHPFYASPAVANSTLVIGDTGGNLFCVRISKGTLVWKTNLKGVVNSTAAIASDIAYVGTLNKKIFGISIPDGAIVWTDSVQGRIKTPPAIGGGAIYIASDDRVLTAFTGTK